MTDHPRVHVFEDGSVLVRGVSHLYVYTDRMQIMPDQIAEFIERVEPKDPELVEQVRAAVAAQ